MSAGDAPFWDVRDLTFAFGRRRLLDGLTWRVGRGEFWGLLGPNGAGKTTLCLAMLGFHRAQAGTLACRGRAVAGWPRAEFARTVAYLPQHEEHAFSLRVSDVVELGRFARAASPTLGGSEEDHRAAIAALERVGMLDFRDAIFGSLSGGERRLVLLARCLAQDTPGLVLDEPAASLDPRHQLRLFAILRELLDEGRTIVAVAHDFSLVARHATHAAVLHEGRMAAAGPAREVLAGDSLERVFGVRFTRMTDEAGAPVVVAAG